MSIHQISFFYHSVCLFKPINIAPNTQLKQHSISLKADAISIAQDDDGVVNSPFKAQHLDLTGTKFPIKDDQSKLDSIETNSLWCFLGLIVAVFATAYFFVMKRDYKMGAASIVSAGGFYKGSLYLVKQSKSVSFDIANKVLSHYLNSGTLVLKRSDYGLS